MQSRSRDVLAVVIAWRSGRGTVVGRVVVVGLLSRRTLVPPPGASSPGTSSKDLSDSLSSNQSPFDLDSVAKLSKATKELVMGSPRLDAHGDVSGGKPLMQVLDSPE